MTADTLPQAIVTAVARERARLAAIIRDDRWRRCAKCAAHDAHDACDPPDWDRLAKMVEATEPAE